MTHRQIEKIIKSTAHLVLTDPVTVMPKSCGSGSLVIYEGRKLLLSVAHVTDKMAATCIITDGPPVNGRTPLYSVGALNYLAAFNIDQINDQILKIADTSIRKEDKDFGVVDFSYVRLTQNIPIYQREITVKDFTVGAGLKEFSDFSFLHRPQKNTEYGFFGRIKPRLIHGFQMFFKTQEIYYGGLRFIEKINDYYKFELPNIIQDGIDFKGTSGAPIMDADGNIVSLVTHGYTGDNKIYGIALGDYKVGVDASIISGTI